MVYATSWHCDYVGLPSATGMDCTVTATSTAEDTNTGSTTIQGGYNGPTYYEWLFVACALLFFVAYLGFQRIFSSPKK